MDWSKINYIHFIGIKGVGMTMLAQYLAGLGKAISGSDVAETFMTDQVLKAIGADVKLGFAADHLPPEADLIVYSTAYNNSNPELAAALAGSVKTLSYAEALAGVFNQSYGLAVCGSHGKTTTTAWLGYLLHKARLEPSVMVGAFVPQLAGASLVGKSNYLIIEADEYQNKLGFFWPKVVIINNIDYDHPDFFPDRASYLQVFRDFLTKVPKDGFIIANFDDPLVKELCLSSGSKVFSYSLVDKEADLQASVSRYHQGRQYFQVTLHGESLGDFSVALAGAHNLANGLAVLACALELGVDLLTIRSYLGEFTGTARRLETLGRYQGALVIDDYAHHPTEIRATISALRQAYADQRLTVVFHPHTYSRTKALLSDFAMSFDGVDELIILEIYASARESRIDFSSRFLIELIRQRQPDLKITYVADLAQAEAELRSRLFSDQDIIAFLGAGDLFRVGHRLVKSGG